MEIQQIAEIHIVQTIDIGCHKSRLKPVSQVVDAATCVCLGARVHQLDLPRIAAILEVIDNDLLPITQGKYKIVISLTGKDLHSLTNYWRAVYRHHGLREVLRIRIGPCTAPTCQNYDLHTDHSSFGKFIRPTQHSLIVRSAC